MRASIAICSIPVLTFAWLQAANADEYEISRRAQWLEWTANEIPVLDTETLDLRPDGSVSLRKFDQNFNAALDAPLFFHEEKQGGIREVGSNQRDAPNIIDGDPETYWQPDADAPLEDWFIEIDLGRVVPVTRVRILFPDEEGAKPFEEFRVFESDGLRVASGDVFTFDLIGGTTRQNFETEVEYTIRERGGGATAVLGRGGVDESNEHLTEPFVMIQYIGLWADARNDDAAIAEFEVYTFGENVSLGTLQRGGSIVEGTGLGPRVADGDFNTTWGSLVSFEHEGGGGESGFTESEALVWDLGALFWVHQILWLPPVAHLDNFRFLSSDGSLNLAGDFEFEIMFDFGHLTAFGGFSRITGTTTGGAGGEPNIRYLFLPPKRIRYLSGIFQGGIGGQLRTGDIKEVVVVPAGHVAQVEMKSPFIDLGRIGGDNRIKVIDALTWETDPLPPGAFVQARTRTGNTLAEEVTYFDRAGAQLSGKTEYDDLNKRMRGRTDTATVIGDDWSPWSKIYQDAGQEFLSPSPRRFAQIELLLGSDRPETTPALHSVSLEYTNAILAGVDGEVHPRTASAGVVEEFILGIQPEFRSGDSGFNLIKLLTPSAVDGLTISIGGNVVEDARVEIVPDSLLIELSQPVTRQSVELNFRLALLENPTYFNTQIGHTEQPGLWQPVDPRGRYATTVFLPSLPETAEAVGSLSIKPQLLTPNGDDFGEQTAIRFNALKADATPEVKVFDLQGRLMAELTGERGSDQVLTHAWTYTWSGRNPSGALVPPGIYVCWVKLEGDEAVARTISVAY